MKASLSQFMALPTRTRVLFLAACVILGFLVGYGVMYEPQNGADVSDEEKVALGQRVYAQHCASCHGADLSGEAVGDWRTPKPDGTYPAPPHDETGHTWHHDDLLLFRYVKEGGQAIVPDGFKSGMQAFAGTLSDGEIWAVLAYIKSTWPRKIQAIQEQRNQTVK